MFRNKKVDATFLNISKEHTLIQKYLIEFEAILNQGFLSHSFLELKKSIKTFKGDFLDHFQLEETFLFPTALLCIPSVENIDLILCLQKEHGCFEKEIEFILEQVRIQPEKDLQIHEILFKQLSDFTARMSAHAETEMSQLFPQLDADSRAQEIIHGFTVKE